MNPVELVRNMVHTAMEKGSDVKEEVQTMLALMLAKAAAIVYGQVLSNEEMANLVDSLFACPTPNYTPDGRTVLSTIKEEDIEKLFSQIKIKGNNKNNLFQKPFSGDGVI